MILVDTNLWLYAALQDTPQHSAAQAWLEARFNDQESIALPWSVALAVLRISTQRRLMQQPLSPTQAIELVEGWLEHPLVTVVQPGPSHWSILRLLIQEAGTVGNLTMDAHLADSDYRRFAGLRVINPLA